MIATAAAKGDVCLPLPMGTIATAAANGDVCLLLPMGTTIARLLLPMGTSETTAFLLPTRTGDDCLLLPMGTTAATAASANGDDCCDCFCQQ